MSSVHKELSREGPAWPRVPPVPLALVLNSYTMRSAEVLRRGTRDLCICVHVCIRMCGHVLHLL